MHQKVFLFPKNRGLGGNQINLYANPYRVISCIQGTNKGIIIAQFRGLYPTQPYPKWWSVKVKEGHLTFGQ